MDALNRAGHRRIALFSISPETTLVTSKSFKFWCLKVHGAVPQNLIQRHAGSLSEIRRHLHQHPELSGQEYQTTEFLAKELSGANIPFRLGPDRRGIIVDLGAENAQQRIALRADIDALPVDDAKQTDYRSRVQTVMHACGHDAHATILLATVKVLHELFAQHSPRHAVRAIFQPEEETATGARTMIESGALEGVTAIVAAHVDPLRESGTVGLRSGIISAHCDEVFVEVVGRSGHAARPREAIDPVEIAAELIYRCYQKVPRYTEAADRLVLSFTVIQGGAQCNVIPDMVSIKGTMRSLDPPMREAAIANMNSIVQELEQSTGAKISLRFGLEVPSVIGDENATDVVRSICTRVLGQNQVQPIPYPSMGGEDFAFYSRRVPAAFIRLGSRSPDIGQYPLHNCRFDIDEGVLTMGLNVMTHIGSNFFAEAI